MMPFRCLTRVLPLLAAGFTVFLPALLPAAPVAETFRLSEKYLPGDVYQGVRLLGALRLDKTKVDGFDLRELSGLAWDADAGVLIMLSDDGYIAHTRPQFDNGILTGLEYLAAFPLTEPDGSPVRDKASDSEGLAIRNADNGIDGDTELLVSFEVFPRLHRYTVEGRFLEAIDMPAPLRDINNYDGDNKAVEAITLHPQYGLLMAPESRLRDDDSATLPLFDGSRALWRYTPVDSKHSAIVELEMAADGRLLVLERRYKSIFSPVIFSIRALRLPVPETPAAAPPVTDIARFASNGETRVDNFEGLARHEGDRYFMVSDDNESAIQKTLLLYLSIPAEGEAP